MYLLTKWEGRTGFNVWLKVRTCGLSAVKSVGPDREPNIFMSGLKKKKKKVFYLLVMTIVFEFF